MNTETITRVVPVEPTEAQWSGLARDIVMWWRMELQVTDQRGSSLLKHLERCGTIAPRWLIEEIDGDSPTGTLSKGTVAAIIYKAMVYDAPPPPSTQADARDAARWRKLCELFGRLDGGLYLQIMGDDLTLYTEADLTAYIDRAQESGNAD